jgi:chromate reductase
MPQVVGLAGSLRKSSYNRALLRAAIGLAPPGMTITVHTLDAIPLYNGDVEAAGTPEAVTALGAAIRAADGLLLVTPEYNHGIPGVLKNAIDWLSRPPKPQAFDATPVAIGGATPGGFGTRGAQYQLRQCLTPLNAFVMPQPSLMLPAAPEKFDAAGTLVDAKTRETVQRFLAGFAAWIARLGGPAD